ncbi:MAG: glycosyltransferase family 4 protein [Armatimonadota bacterium]
MRIAILNEYFYPENSGGTPTVLSQLARSLKEQYPENDIEVITSRNLYRTVTTTPMREEEWDGIRISRLSTPKSNRPSMVLRLLAGIWFTLRALLLLLLRPRYDLVFVLGSPPAIPLAAQCYRRLRGVPYVYLVHDLFPDIAVALGRLSRESLVTRCCRYMQKSWLRGAARVAVLGRCMREFLVREYQISAIHVSILTNWADATVIYPMERDNAFRRQHGLSGFVVLYAGNLGAYNNLDQILDAAHTLRDGHPEITFAIVGDGSEHEAILLRAEREGLTNVRVFPPVPMEAMNEILASADVSLVPLDMRMQGLGVPSKIYPSLASCRPVIVIAGEESELVHIMQEERCGLSVAPGNSHALTAAILAIQADPDAAAAMGHRARLAVEQRYTVERVSAQCQELFQSVIQREAVINTCYEGGRQG